MTHVILHLIYPLHRHPIAILFHVLFRTLALLLYVFGSYIFSNSFVELFIFVILLLAFDFWVVKNVTGRLLVGLRWWNKVEPDGTSSWMFETKKVCQRYMINKEMITMGLTCSSVPLSYIISKLVY